MNSKEAKTKRYQRARHCAIRNRRQRQRWEAIQQQRDEVRQRRFRKSNAATRQHLIAKPVTERELRRTPKAEEFTDNLSITFPSGYYYDEDELFGEIDVFLKATSRHKGGTQHEPMLVAR